jgi:hypothetical protein
MSGEAESESGEAVTSRSPRRCVSAHEVILIAAAAVCSTKTVERVFDGRGNAFSRYRVRTAALELGLPAPPAASAAVA